MAKLKAPTYIGGIPIDPSDPTVGDALIFDGIQFAPADPGGGGSGLFLPLAGGTMSGFIVLHADPTSALHAASKQYVDRGYHPGPSLYLTTSGNFTKATYPGLRAIQLELVGGGGGSGGVQTTSSTQTALGGSGGGSAYVRSLVLASDLDTVEAYIVGAGGIAGTHLVDGGDGEDSVFDTISGEVRAQGGRGGAFGTAQTFPNAGAAGGVGGSVSSSSGDFRVAGSDGGSGIGYSNNRILLGSSGMSLLGAGRAMGAANSSAGGSAGYPYGGGARGARQIPSGGTNLGGSAGGPGVIILTPLY